MDRLISNIEFINFQDLIEIVQPGETVLVEYRTSYVPEFALKLAADYTREEGVPFVIDDDFDTLYALILHLKLMGVEVNLDHAHVIKTGGVHEIGGEVRRIEFHPDPRVYLKNYAGVSAEILRAEKTPAMNVVVGLENILTIVSRDFRDFYRFLLNLQMYLGNKKRMAFYLINKDVAESMMPNFVLPELERIATTVIETNTYQTSAILTFKKSINLATVGTVVGIDAGGILSGRGNYL